MSCRVGNDSRESVYRSVDLGTKKMGKNNVSPRIGGSGERLARECHHPHSNSILFYCLYFCIGYPSGQLRLRLVVDGTKKPTI